MPDPEDIAEEPPASEELDASEPTTDQATVDAGTKRGVRRQTLTKKRRERDEGDFYRMVFSTTVGRRAMWDILASLHTFETRFAAGPTGFPDQMATWFYAGEQATGQRLFKTWFKLDRDGVMLMLEEHDAELQKAK